MKIKKLTLHVLIGAGILSGLGSAPLWAQSIDITGTVKNSQGQPVVGASLLLIGKKLTTTTNAQGQYSFKVVPTGILGGGRLFHGPQDAPFRVTPGWLHLNLGTRDRVDIGIYSADGAKIHQILDATLNPGEHRFALDQNLDRPQAYMARVMVGERSWSVPLSSLKSAAGLPSSGSTESIPLAKGSAAAVDSIKATAKGYVTKTTPIESYTGTQNIILTPSAYSGTVVIDSVYFAQTHVHEPSHPYFGLTGGRETLIKAHILSPVGSPAPPVYAVLKLKGNSLNLELKGPKVLPVSIPTGPGIVQHQYENSFTGILPEAWIKPGLSVTIEAADKSRTFDSLKIGAPSEVFMTMFDIHYFAPATGDYKAGWLQELESKWPVRTLHLQRVPNIIFKELVIPPRADVKAPAVRVASREDYKTKTGLNFDGEQAAALQWNGALKAAAGTSGRLRLYYTNIYGVHAGGQAGGFAGVGGVGNLGILHHELGHALSLPHWGDAAAYPYKGDMFGIPAPEVYNGTHAGPTWAFDIPSRSFIPPTVQTTSGRWVAGTYKADPMQGGGTGDEEPKYLFRHFSDYSVRQMQNYLQNHVVIWNSGLNSYAGWNAATGNYDKVVANNGVQFPVVRDAQVISVMAGVSSVTPEANLVYPPIGPYKAGLITLFDPSVVADRAKAASIFCPTEGCDVSLRITQGGKVKTYMLAIPIVPTADPLTGASFRTRAINLPAADGEVIRIDLLSTPDAEKAGLPNTPVVLDTWQK